MKIAIEGMDGVGKSTIAQRIASCMNMTYVEKPLVDFFSSNDSDGKTELAKICKKVYNFEDEILKAWFFGLGNLYTFIEYKEDIVIDRHFASNFFWNGSIKSEPIFKTMIELIGVPDITIVLFASWQTRKERILKRDKNDPDLFDTEKMVEGYDKMCSFLETFNVPYYIIDTENKSVEEVLDEILKIIEKHISNSKQKVLK